MVVCAFGRHFSKQNRSIVYYIPLCTTIVHYTTLLILRSSSFVRLAAISVSKTAPLRTSVLRYFGTSVGYVEKTPTGASLNLVR